MRVCGRSIALEIPSLRTLCLLSRDTHIAAGEAMDIATDRSR